MGKFFGLLFVALLAFCFQSWLIQLVWNSVVPQVFPGLTASLMPSTSWILGHLNFGQAMGINLLTSLLFHRVKTTAQEANKE